MLVEIITIPPCCCLVRRPVSPLIAAAPLVFRRFVTRTIVGGRAVRPRLVPIVFTIVASLLCMIPISVRLGASDPSILRLIVPVPTCLTSVRIIGRVMLVLSSVMCILWAVLWTPLLASCVWLCSPLTALDRCLARSLNTVGLM